MSFEQDVVKMAELKMSKFAGYDQEGMSQSAQDLMQGPPPQMPGAPSYGESMGIPAGLSGSLGQGNQLDPNGINPMLLEKYTGGQSSASGVPDALSGLLGGAPSFGALPPVTSGVEGSGNVANSQMQNTWQQQGAQMAGDIANSWPVQGMDSFLENLRNSPTLQNMIQHIDPTSRELNQYASDRGQEVVDQNKGMVQRLMDGQGSRTGVPAHLQDLLGDPQFNGMPGEARDNVPQNQGNSPSNRKNRYPGNFNV